MKFDFDDILLTPGILFSPDSRKEINPFDEFTMLPIFTAPMDTVVSKDNFDKFLMNKIRTILPRNKDVQYSYLEHRWYSYGLNEFEDLFLNKTPHTQAKLYALIDVANGHMKKVFTIAKAAKEKYGDKLVLMVGNIANPKTFIEYAQIGVDYIRCGIGGGEGCLTSVQTGVGYPMASLIHECNLYKKEHGFKTKIVADGGFKKYSDINKALALGADYVMLGGMLNKCLESAGETVYKAGNTYVVKEVYDYWVVKNLISGSTKKTELELIAEGILHKKYRGMSTKEVQREWGRSEIKTSEGITKFNTVLYTIEGWARNMEDYLRSAMSYTGSFTLDEFNSTQFELITQASYNRFNK